MTAPDPEHRLAAAVAEAMARHDRVGPSLSIVVDDIRPRYCRVRMTVRDDMLNAHGICHGGIVFTLADCAFAYACNAENRSTLATSCNVSFMAPARAGDELTAIAEARIHNTRLGVYDVTVTDAAGRTVALFRGNCFSVGGATLDALAAVETST